MPCSFGLFSASWTSCSDGLLHCTQQVLTKVTLPDAQHSGSATQGSQVEEEIWAPGPMCFMQVGPGHQQLRSFADVVRPLGIAVAVSVQRGCLQASVLEGSDRYGVIQEPIFVPRADASAEDDGWVLVMVNNAESQRTDLCVLDARSIAAGASGTAPLSATLLALALVSHVPRCSFGGGLQIEGLTLRLSAGAQGPCARCTCRTMCRPACTAAGRTRCTCSHQQRRQSTGSPASALSAIDAGARRRIDTGFIRAGESLPHS
jgi:Retinal pigment epithelial membrane protein